MFEVEISLAKHRLVCHCFPYFDLLVLFEKQTFKLKKLSLTCEEADADEEKNSFRYSHRRGNRSGDVGILLLHVASINFHR